MTTPIISTPFMGLIDSTGGFYENLSDFDKANIQEGIGSTWIYIIIGAWLLAELFSKKGF